MTSESSVAESKLESTTFTRSQASRGLVLLGGFVVIRAVAARAWNQFFDGGYSTDPAFLAFLGGIFLLLSVGLVYLGFTRWVGVDLPAWWVDRDRLRGDVLWGIIGTVAILVVTVATVLLLTELFPGLIPAQPESGSTIPGVAGAEAEASGGALTLLLGWFSASPSPRSKRRQSSGGSSSNFSTITGGEESRSSANRPSSRSHISGTIRYRHGHSSSWSFWSDSSLDGWSIDAAPSCRLV